MAQHDTDRGHGVQQSLGELVDELDSGWGTLLRMQDPAIDHPETASSGGADAPVDIMEAIGSLADERAVRQGEHTIVSAAIAHPLTFLGVTAGILILAVGFLTATAGFSSAALIQVQDARSATLLETVTVGGGDSYVDDQVAILRTPAVALRASELAAEQLPGTELTANNILGASTVSAVGTSSVISVEFASEDPDLAEAMAPIIIDAYRDVKLTEALRGYDSALSEIDISIASNRALVADLDEQIEVAGGEDLSTGLERRFTEAIDRLLSIDDIVAATDVDEANLILAQVSAVQQEIAAIERASVVQRGSGEVSGLIQERSAAVDRISDLIGTRDRLALEAQLNGAGIVFESPASEAELDLSRTILGLAGVAAILLGLVASYARAMTARTGPE